MSLQADANDTYKVMGSADGSPGSYKLIVELANVVSTGHGLRTRATQVTPTTVRYLRIGDANGDTFFTVSEFQAFCKAPTPFPPGMKIVDVPPPAAADSPATPKPGSDTGRWALLLTAVALALAWLAYKTITRPSGGSGGRRRRRRRQDGREGRRRPAPVGQAPDRRSWNVDPMAGDDGGAGPDARHVVAEARADWIARDDPAGTRALAGPLRRPAPARDRLPDGVPDPGEPGRRA